MPELLPPDGAPPERLLPPEIEAHPPMQLRCPHCGATLVLRLSWMYIWATEHTTYGTRTPQERQALLERSDRRVRCEPCQGTICVQLIPHVTYEVQATAPDPLEHYPPNSRYWERVKRGLSGSGNLKLDPDLPPE